MNGFKSLFLVEALLLVMIGLFSLDFIPRNYNEYQRICLQTWSNDAKQLKICMEPYYKQTGLDKYAIGVMVGGLILVPVVYFFKRKQN
jgi:hypothetical protein